MRKVMWSGVVACLLMGARCEPERAEPEHERPPCSSSGQGCPSDEDAGAAVDDSAADDRAADADAGTPAEHREPTPEPKPEPQPEPMPPTSDGPVSCPGLHAGRVPAGLELITSSNNSGLFAALASDAQHVYGLRGGDSGEEIYRIDAGASELHVVTQHLDAVQVLVVDGGEIFFNSASSGRDVFVSKVPINGGDVLNIAHENYANVLALIVDGDRVFWLGNGGSSEPGEIVLFQSDRAPGDTVVLARVSGGFSDSLVRIGDALYFTVTQNVTPVRAQIYRVALGGANEAMPLGEPDGIAALATDGETLFAGLVGVRDRLNNLTGTRGVARVDLEDGSLEPLFPDLQASAGMLSVDDASVVWGSTYDAGEGQLWIGAKNSVGKPFKIASGWPASVGLTRNASGVYWSVRCDSSDYVLRATPPK